MWIFEVLTTSKEADIWDRFPSPLHLSLCSVFLSIPGRVAKSSLHLVLPWSEISTQIPSAFVQNFLQECSFSLQRIMWWLFHVFSHNMRDVFSKDELGTEILQIAFPAAMGLMADPIASLVDTAFIGQIGAVELAAVGVAIAVFNQASRVTIFPVVSITTSLVAEEGIILDKTYQLEELSPLKNNPDKPILGTSSFTENRSINVSRFGHERKHVPSVSTALIVGGILGFLQAIVLIFGAKSILKIMGVKADSPMFIPAIEYLTLRSLGSPAVVLSLALQGVFRGFKNTRTPLYATVAGDMANIILDPILIFILGFGVNGAAIAHVLSQYLIALMLLWELTKQVDVFPKNLECLQFIRFIKNGSWLLVRVIAVTLCVTLASSMAATQGSVPMAAFQICLQIWLAMSLLADGLAIAGQAILAGAFAQGDHQRAILGASRVLQLSVVLGSILSVLLGIGMPFASHLFTRDVEVLKLINKAIPFVAATQPINAMAFVFDGINFGASDFTYSACSMVVVAVVSILCVVFLSAGYGFVGIWIALTIYMSLRMIAGFCRIGMAKGPWTFLDTR